MDALIWTRDGSCLKFLPAVAGPSAMAMGLEIVCAQPWPHQYNQVVRYLSHRCCLSPARVLLPWTTTATVNSFDRALHFSTSVVCSLHLSASALDCRNQCVCAETALDCTLIRHSRRFEARASIGRTSKQALSISRLEDPRGSCGIYGSPRKQTLSLDHPFLAIVSSSLSIEDASLGQRLLCNHVASLFHVDHFGQCISQTSRRYAAGARHDGRPSLALALNLFL
jgi:hypothetical protein